MRVVRVAGLEDPEGIAGEMGIIVPHEVKALEAGRRAMGVATCREVMRRLVVLEECGHPTKARQGKFMETLFYYLCWLGRVGVGVRGLLMVALVVEARS